MNPLPLAPGESPHPWRSDSDRPRSVPGRWSQASPALTPHSRKPEDSWASRPRALNSSEKPCFGSGKGEPAAKIRAEAGLGVAAVEPQAHFEGRRQRWQRLYPSRSSAATSSMLRSSTSPAIICPAAIRFLSHAAANGSISL